LFHEFFYSRFFGFVDLNNEDQIELKEKFGTSTNSKRKRKGEAMNNESTKAKQAKVEDITSEETRLKKEQNELLWSYKDNLRKEIPNDILKELLEFNNQMRISGESNLIEAVTDCMVFGALEPCPECGGFLVFKYIIFLREFFSLSISIFLVIQIIVVQAILLNGQSVRIQHNYLNENHLKFQIKSKKTIPTSCKFFYS
jgi:hypothetical protein